METVFFILFFPPSASSIRVWAERSFETFIVDITNIFIKVLANIVLVYDDFV